MPQAPDVWFRPLLLNTVTGSWCNLLRVRKSGVLSRHIHPSWVTGYVIKGAWRYLEHDWVAREGASSTSRRARSTRWWSTSRSAPRDDHLLQHPRRDGLRRRRAASVTGYEDVFTKIAMCRKHYAECGLGEGYVDTLVR